MRYCRLEVGGMARYAEAEGDGWALLSKAPWAGGFPTGEKVSRSDAKFLVPTEASKVVCVGQNYKKHAEELGKSVPPEPLIFIKPSTALNPTQSPIVLPRASQEVHHE